jgi:poly(3-hydroxybutyrate) depolymerase
MRVDAKGGLTMIYLLYDLQHALLTPARLGAEAMASLYRQPWNPLSYTQAGRTVSAYAELFERSTRRFGKPDFGLHETIIDGSPVDVIEEFLLNKPFCSLLHFKRKTRRNDPKVLIVAPMSGHFATLLRGTVEALLPHHDVYITDWIDARQVPLSAGRFNLDDYIAYLREFMSLLGPETHLIAVCQPAVPVYAAIALMEAENDPNTPLTMTLMGGPIDPRISKTKVTELAETRPLTWFENSVIDEVPFYYPGAHRKVYPGFIQLTGFMSMNLDRHVGSHMKFFGHLVKGDGEPEAHRRFYNEYLSVMDMPAEFYLQTVQTVFQNHALPRGLMKWRDPETGKLHDVDPGAIRHTAILTVEGELDDISAHGQTTAAHTLATNLPANRQYHHFQENVGHYGIFNGRRWRTHIMPRIRHFIRQFDTDVDAVPKDDLVQIPDKVAAHWNKAEHSVEAVRERLRRKGIDPHAEPAEGVHASPQG